MRAEIEKKITDNSNPNKVSLVGMNIKDNEILEIMEMINKVKPTATTIDLDDNKIGDKGAKILSEKIHEFADMKEISLQFNKIGREGALDVFSLKNTFPDIDILFHGNKITDVFEMDEIERRALKTSPGL